MAREENARPRPGMETKVFYREYPCDIKNIPLKSCCTYMGVPDVV